MNDFCDCINILITLALPDAPTSAGGGRPLGGDLSSPLLRRAAPHLPAPLRTAPLRTAPHRTAPPPLRIFLQGSRTGPAAHGQLRVLSFPPGAVPPLSPRPGVLLLRPRPGAVEAAASSKTLPRDVKGQQGALSNPGGCSGSCPKVRPRFPSAAFEALGHFR